MKRVFLQNLKVGDQPLSKEVIDAILNEHSRSIGTLKAEKESLETQLQTARDGLKAFEGVDVKDLQGQITKLQQDLTDKDNAHKTELANILSCRPQVSGGERGERRLWRIQRAERVAAVGKMQAWFTRRSICRAPQQETAT